MGLLTTRMFRRRKDKMLRVKRDKLNRAEADKADEPDEAEDVEAEVERSTDGATSWEEIDAEIEAARDPTNGAMEWSEAEQHEEQSVVILDWDDIGPASPEAARVETLDKRIAEATAKLAAARERHQKAQDGLGSLNGNDGGDFDKQLADATAELQCTQTECEALGGVLGGLTKSRNHTAKAADRAELQKLRKQKMLLVMHSDKAHVRTIETLAEFRQARRQEKRIVDAATHVHHRIEIILARSFAKPAKRDMFGQIVCEAPSLGATSQAILGAQPGLQPLPK